MESEKLECNKPAFVILTLRGFLCGNLSFNNISSNVDVRQNRLNGTNQIWKDDKILMYFVLVLSKG